MPQTTSIRILEQDNNRRGDLFGRLMADLFVALGYQQPRLTVHKSGRELDLSAEHRLESRCAIAECKATADPIGGGDLNKFVGALDVEGKEKTTGYFISLAGFTETAIEQEKQRRTKIVLLTGSQVVEELVKGRILISKEQATDLAGRCCGDLKNLVLDPDAALLAHERGWIWAVYYTQGKVPTHVALVHSDGTPLARALAEEVIASDRDCAGTLHTFTCLNPTPQPVVDSLAQIEEALTAYRQYIANECGDIQLDGLPADSEAGSRRLQLENLFVPLHLDVTVQVEGKTEKQLRQPVGALLTGTPRLALLAAPGSGKSTLIKRLAVAYTDSARLAQGADDLPQRPWLPLFVRCRELRDVARGSFAQLLEFLSQRELVRQHATVFRAHVDRELLGGRVLLLVDGLDEISDSGDRAAFVCTLRSALQAYPDVGLVVTSREAGFRHVAAHLAPVCTHAALSPFDEDDISRLCVAWHREVVGDTEKVIADSERLAATIVQNDRIQRLAVNPLLLTTLLLVKRWVGALPTRRAVLYGKAVEVLLMTWNTEGHDPIPDEEALPQLCYVASAMMLGGVQKISRPGLAALLQEARNALPTELGYVKGTVDEFIHRVEDRSSLLMMTGHDVEDGRIVEFFEFRHLTFQEFLTARAIVEGWHPGRQEKDTLASVLEPHFSEETWREVIPLAAVLGGKETEELIRKLTQQVERLEVSSSHARILNRPDLPFFSLANCLADEAAARPETIRAALRALVRLGRHLEQIDFFTTLVRGRYGADLRTEARKAFFAPEADIRNAGGALNISVGDQLTEIVDTTGYDDAAKQMVVLLNSSEMSDRCEGAFGCLQICFLLHRQRLQYDQVRRQQRQYDQAIFADHMRSMGSALVPMIFSQHVQEQYAASFALVWLGVWRVWTPPAEPDVLSRLFMLWRHSSHAEVRRFASWSLANQRVAPRDDTRYCSSIPPDEVESVLKSQTGLEKREQICGLVAAWYLHALTDAELVERARALYEVPDPYNSAATLKELLEYLGEQP
ncbi:MAG: hypothetical protein JWN14_4574 [Chthonomonadales bacterium]|nr:hypothetical protein [Chthonomonadales bacterium]